MTQATFEAPPVATFTWLKATIALYFWLLIWEGALRKWVLPQYSDVLFLIRDPVVMLAYVFALHSGVFPWRPCLAFLIGFIALSLLFSLASNNLLLVTLLGLRTDYLHLPFIFVMAQVLDRGEVLRYGRWFLICSIPIVLLMLLQFSASPTDWLNVGAGGTPGSQLTGALGKIRPPGPFAFITGPVYFFGFVAAFAVYGWIHPRVFSRRLLIPASLALAAAVPISISRSLLMQVLIVLGFGAVAVFGDLRRVPRLLAPLAAIAALVATLADTVYVRAFSARWEGALGEGGFQRSVVDRLLGGLTVAWDAVEHAPPLGFGIGLGTVGSGRLAGSKLSFTLGESELARIVMELGPGLGFAFIAWRFWLGGSLVFGGWNYLRHRHDSLSWLIAAAAFMNVLNGQWGPATQLGFAIFGAGLCLAARNEPAESDA